MQPKIVAHGGAWDWDDAHDEGKRTGLETAIAIGYDILKRGGGALDAVEQTVIALEDNPVFDAGTGGYLNQAGIVQLDALIVDGATHDFGAVGAVSRVRNPIALARKIMLETEHCFIVGAGADQVAQALGIPLIDNEILVTDAMRAFYVARRTDGKPDTVGAIAIDQFGNTAAATSTSGTPYKRVGRIGDSPLFGAGGYAENGVGAVGATGMGENIMRTLLAKYTADRLGDGMSPSDAGLAAMGYVEGLFSNSMCGVIMVDADGNIGAAHTTPKLAVGWVDREGVIRSSMAGAAVS
jgi:beta-aspartyl-peptidase (threonine type)